MSLSSGPLTAPLARIRGATASGSMTRIRYVSRVPGPCSADSATKMLVNDDGPTRLLECSASARPAPAAVGEPPPEESSRKGHDHPERERAGADRRAGHDERVRIPGRARQGDTDFQMARPGAGAMRAGRQMLGERRALDQRQLTVQLGIDLREPLLVRAIDSGHLELLPHAVPQRTALHPAHRKRVL